MSTAITLTLEQLQQEIRDGLAGMQDSHDVPAFMAYMYYKGWTGGVIDPDKQLPPEEHERTLKWGAFEYDRFVEYQKKNNWKIELTAELHELSPKHRKQVESIVYFMGWMGRTLDKREVLVKHISLLMQGAFFIFQARVFAK